MLCRKCLQIDGELIRSGQTINHHPSFIHLKDAAHTGCELCSLFLARFFMLYDSNVIGQLLRQNNYSTRNDNNTSIELRGAIYVCGPHSGQENLNRLWIMCGSTSQNQDPISADIGICAAPDSKAAQYISSRPVATRPDSDTSLDTIKHWISNCNQKHDCLPKEPPLLPTRVLDLSTLTVVTTSSERAHYIALSYCWGVNNFPLLTHDTISQFQTTGINVSLLPRTIRDAIKLAAKLGIAYLWVDSLCIIQQESDPHDFRQETMKMDQYYQNAYFTLAAGSAADCSRGFLNARRPNMSCKIPYNETQRNSDLYLCIPTKTDIGPLSRRAWALQERELSTRILTFGEQQFSFRCPAMHLYEDGDWVMQSSFTNSSSPHTCSSSSSSSSSSLSSAYTRSSSSSVYPASPSSMDHSSLSAPSPPNSVPSSLNALLSDKHITTDSHVSFQYWYSMVSEFTSRRLTWETDRFAALAGLAKRTQKSTHSRYCYGLWADDMVCGLLWRPTSLARRTRRELVRVPSWSWASVTGSVSWGQCRGSDEWMRDEKNECLRIKSLGNLSSSLDPIQDGAGTGTGFGATAMQLDSDSDYYVDDWDYMQRSPDMYGLRVVAPIKRVQMLPYVGLNLTPFPQLNVQRHELHLRTLVNCNVSKYITPDEIQSHQIVGYGQRDDSECELMEEEEFWAIRVTFREGLLLKPEVIGGRRRPGYFRRVGWFSIYENDASSTGFLGYKSEEIILF